MIRSGPLFVLLAEWGLFDGGVSCAGAGQFAFHDGEGVDGVEGRRFGKVRVGEQALQGLLLVGGKRGLDAGEREMWGEWAFLDCEAALL